jgi:PncC family amidohydrolase
MNIYKENAKKLLLNNKTITLAESCTGGLLSHKLTNVPGSSRFLKCAIVAYSNEAKIKILNVPKKEIKQFGAVSAQVALSMAKGARKIFNTHYAISLSGIAGPAGATAQKPIGLTFIAVATNKENIVKRFIFKGTRLQVKQQASLKALTLLEDLLP